MAVSGPPITYQDGTLTFPIYNISEGSVSGSGVAVLDVNTTSAYSGLPGGPDRSRNPEITVTTAYHNRWEEYFWSMGNTSIKTSDTGEYRTVEAIVGLSELPEEIEDVNLNIDRDSVLSATGGSVTTSDASNSQTGDNIVSLGDVTVSHPVYGSVISGGDVTVDRPGEVHGQIIAAGAVNTGWDNHVESVLAGDDVVVEGNVDGDLVATRSITDHGSCVRDCGQRERPVRRDRPALGRRTGRSTRTRVDRPGLQLDPRSGRG